MPDFSKAGPQQPEYEETETRSTNSERYVRWQDIERAVKSRETEILDKLGIIWRSHRETHTRCPLGTHPDNHPSFRWDEGEAHYFCTCGDGSVFDVIMMVEHIDFEQAKTRAAELIGHEELIVGPTSRKQEPQGLTLEEYAAAKQLPIEELQRIGVRNTSYGQVRAISTPYFRLNGEPRMRFRVNLNGDKNKRHFWRKGDKACLYGEWYLGHQAFLSSGYVVIVEGESDSQTCWFNGAFPALGLPGAGQFSEERDAPLLADIPTVFVVIEHNDQGERDSGGKVLLQRIARSSIAPRVRLVRLPDGIKDPSALHLSDPAGFPTAFRAALDAAQPIAPELIKAVQEQRPPEAAYGVSRDDFYAYMPMHNYIFVPTRSMWPAGSVNARLGQISVGGGDEIPASLWLDNHKPVEQMTWAPGLPMVIRDRLIQDGGWIDRKGVSCFNQYLPPTITGGDPSRAGPWIAHIRYVYPNDADHILDWFAHRVRRPEEKVNHSIVFGGKPGIGKDTLLEPVKQAIGPWNFQDVTPTQITERFNGYLKAVILRISEARDTGGNFDRYQFYEHTKIYMASPPDVLRVDEKHIKEYVIFNVLGVIITTNHKTDGLYLPDDDRRHYVAWSEKIKEDPHFAGDYWNKLWAFYNDGGFAHVAAYLRQRDISGFDPKAPPPKTDAFWEIVDSGRSSEEPELDDVLDAIGRPDAVTLATIQAASSDGFKEWICDRKNRRAIPHKLEACGYIPIRNPTADSGLWVINDKRQVVYAKSELSERDRMDAVRTLVAGKPHAWQQAVQ